MLLKGIRVTMLGGDRREVELARSLVQQGASLRLVGLPPLDGAKSDTDGVVAASWAQVVILPMSGPDGQGRVPTPLAPDVELRLDDELFRAVGSRRPLFIGVLPGAFQSAAKARGVRVVEWTAFDEIAIDNSIPTAEGAVLLAMERLPVTIHGSASLVVGFGRCGFTLARLLHVMGSDVEVAARSPADRARIRELGMRPRSFAELAEAAAGKDVVFNTVPVVVLTAAVLERTKPDVLIVDIASHPAGTNFEAARRLGRQAVHVLGIPGKTAPVTAGRILAKHAPALILAELQRR